MRSTLEVPLYLLYVTKCGRPSLCLGSVCIRNADERSYSNSFGQRLIMGRGEKRSAVRACELPASDEWQKVSPPMNTKDRFFPLFIGQLF